MKCSKCGYDYPARETKCPYCGEPNKLGMEWEKEEDETRKETLLTKAKVLHCKETLRMSKKEKSEKNRKKLRNLENMGFSTFLFLKIDILSVAKK